MPARSIALARASGFAAALLFAVGNAVWALDMPEDGTPVAEILTFYDRTADRIVVGGSLSLLAIGAFVVFAAAVRQLLVEAEADATLATAAFGGALLGMAAGIGAESTNLGVALRARDGELSGELAQPLFEISQQFGAVAMGIGLGVFAIATALAALRAGRVLSRPVAIGVLALGVLVLTPLGHVNWLPGAVLVLVTAAIAVAVRDTA